MDFPELSQQKEKIIEMFRRAEDIPREDVRVIASPYRICPLGAHVDHQGGPVLGMTINSYTLMAFVATDTTDVRLQSHNYPGRVRFDLNQIPEATGSFWGVYARAAALALKEKYKLTKGINGHLNGMLPGCGLSSSASVLLAYLHAFADANELQIKPWEYVALTRRAENGFIGLSNGILDQTSIVFGRRGHLLHIDTKEENVDEMPDVAGDDQYRILVAYSGYSRELTTTGYNSRVQECREAAVELSLLAGTEPAQVLSDVSNEIFFEYGHRLEPMLARRARHYYTEVQRVQEGVAAWGAGKIEEFGSMMTESCFSSIKQYECGSPPIHDLQQIVNSAEGVIGSRFMGGGFGGCVVGLVRPGNAAVAAADVQESYRRLHPEVADQAAAYLGRSDDGVRFI